MEILLFHSDNRWRPVIWRRSALWNDLLNRLDSAWTVGECCYSDSIVAKILPCRQPDLSLWGFAAEADLQWGCREPWRETTNQTFSTTTICKCDLSSPSFINGLIQSPHPIQTVFQDQSSSTRPTMISLPQTILRWILRGAVTSTWRMSIWGGSHLPGLCLTLDSS